MPAVTGFLVLSAGAATLMAPADQNAAPPEVRAAGLLIYRVGGEARAAKPNHGGSGVEFLMMKAAYKPFHWTPPKGHVDEGESDLQTAVRETYEESGLSEKDFVLDRGFKRRLRYLANGKIKETVYFLARVINSSATVNLSEEHTEARWVNAGDGGELAGWEDMAAVLREADEYVSEELNVDEGPQSLE
ncbi:bis(5 -nucleosyl)-tetraphosphatase [Cystoisospora suis]|uniref:Bis(5'-nucleosyl)-tetraphosphatase [asymmetrical] n=1 Tax=Cystoisospora suis TaxID=483139 RepID=A0A2C6LFT0_9APIC|nr:bis(5 -nucleosyl)-tetraphosphatase [Cystoisospora suis]